MASKGIPEKFHPPVTLILPKRMFGSKKVERAFRTNWCQQFPWLHYNIDRDAACMQADNEGRFLSSRAIAQYYTTKYGSYRYRKKFMATPKPDQC